MRIQNLSSSISNEKDHFGGKRVRYIRWQGEVAKYGFSSCITCFTRFIFLLIFSTAVNHSSMDSDTVAVEHLWIFFTRDLLAFANYNEQIHHSIRWSLVTMNTMRRNLQCLRAQIFLRLMSCSQQVLLVWFSCTSCWHSKHLKITIDG